MKWPRSGKVARVMNEISMVDPSVHGLGQIENILPIAVYLNKVW